MTSQSVLLIDSFNPQNIHMTVWAFETMGLKPSEALFAGLTAQAVRGDFNPQSITDTLVDRSARPRFR